MEEIILETDELNALLCIINNYLQVEKDFIENSLSLITLPALTFQSKAITSDDAFEEWCQAACGSDQERAALRKHIELALKEQNEEALFAAYRNSFLTVQAEAEQMLATKAIAQFIFRG